MILDGKKVLITGGTGSFGRHFIRVALKSDVKKLIVFSRDELKQFEMSRETKDSRIQFFVGDVRDRDRLWRAFDGIDFVVHAAALKQIPSCEYNPFEAVKTNVLGAQNIMEAAIDRSVERVVALSTDKAVHPINLYGATKLCSDKLFVSGNSYAGGKRTKFGVVRYGNVLGSRGSVIPLFLKIREKGEHIFPVTDARMTRFWITLDDAVRLVLFALDNMRGGEIFVPKIPSMRLVDLAMAIDSRAEFSIIGIRPGEKLHETMITEDDGRNTKELSNLFIIEPDFHWWRENGHNGHEGRPLPAGFTYCSDKNDRWLSVADLRRLLNLEDEGGEKGYAAPAPSLSL